MEDVASYNFRCAVEYDCPIGQGFEICGESALCKSARNGAFGMKAGVEIRSAALVICCVGVGEICVSTAEFARAMTGGQRDRFVEKEQLCVIAGLHDPAMPVFVDQVADDPRFVPPAGVAEALIFAMKNAAVAHEEAAGRVGDDVAGGENSVLQWHWVSFLFDFRSIAEVTGERGQVWPFH